MRTVLISGASVAGLALADRLAERGLAPTVVEQAPAVRTGGHAVDVRGVALEVLDRMGLWEAARAARTRMRGMSLYDGEGTELWSTTELTWSSGRLESEDIEILREDLVALLLPPARERAEFRFADSIAELQEAADGVQVTFASGARETFDLVVGADGLHSRVRRLAFGAEERYLHHLGAYVAVFSAPNFVGLKDWQVWRQGENATYCLYPVRGNSQLRATLGFMAPALAYDRHDTAAQLDLLAERTAELGGATRELLDAARTAPDFYFDAMAQIRMDGWTRGRTALVGDAGYGPSPLSGQGTSLALVGAEVLAQEVAGSVDDAAPFGRYDARMRSFVALNQALATENPGAGPSEESMERAKGAVSLG